MARPASLAVAMLAVMVTACGLEEPAPAGSQRAGTGTTSRAAAAPAAASEDGPRHRPVSRLGSQRRDRGDLVLSYAELEREDHREIEQAFREERFFEDVLDSLNGSLVLPRDVRVELAACGGVDAYYDPEPKAVTLCYELFEHFLEVFGEQMEEDTDEAREEVASKAVAALAFVFYHELGHALIDVYDLPVTGREEDAVDQLATVMLLETWDAEESELAILSSAEWFDLGAEEGEGEDEGHLADEHGLGGQRYYNLVCWIYGSDSEYFSDVADDWGLPAARAERCESEYARMSAAWDQLLGPHLKPAEEGEEEAEEETEG